MIHLGENTKSTIPGISAGKSQNSYRGLADKPRAKTPETFHNVIVFLLEMNVSSHFPIH